MNVSGVIEWVETVLSMQFLSADVYFISYLPSELQWNDVMIVGGAGLIMSLLATIYPAWRASRFSPRRRCAMSETHLLSSVGTSPRTTGKGAQA